MRILLYITALLFCTSLHAQYKTELYVAQDGSGDFTTIQEAIDETKSFPDQRITIFIKNGIYYEKVKVHAWNPHLTIIGESVEGTIIRWTDHFKAVNRGRNSTFLTPTLWVQADDFRAENITIENTAGAVGQAISVSVEADRCVFVNCRMIGNQDTLFASGANARQHYKNCYIEGTTDFIFGGATALFENCTIHSKSNSYITAASTPRGREYGLVFLECKLTADEEVKRVYLGRPWRSFAKTVFVKCEMGSHIRPEGWHNWSDERKEKTVFYAEYGNHGPGGDTSGRVAWAKRLSETEADKYSSKQILKPFILPEMGE